MLNVTQENIRTTNEHQRAQRAELNAATRPRLSLSELYGKRCKTCALCLKEDCGHCYSCLTNEDICELNRPKLVCLQKVRSLNTLRFVIAKLTNRDVDVFGNQSSYEGTASRGISGRMAVRAP